MVQLKPPHTSQSAASYTTRLFGCGMFLKEMVQLKPPHTHDVLTVVYHPDGKQLACSTLDGQIHFWDPIHGVLMHTIEGRRDIAGGRILTGRRSASTSSAGKYFTTLCYFADGSYILAGGKSKYICMYDVADQVTHLSHCIYLV